MSAAQPPATCFFESAGDDRFRATQATVGPWDPRLQHASPPFALLARALERHEPRDHTMISRVTFELLGPVPVGELRVQVRTDRPGRSVELLHAELSAGGRPVVRAWAWRIGRAQTSAGDLGLDPALALPEHALGDPPAAIAHSGYIRSIEWRAVRGTWNDAGPATVWARPAVAIVDDEPISGLQRVLAVCDSASGLSAELPWHEWIFMNLDLTLHLTREPQGEWILLDAHGFVGRSAQTLLVRPMSAGA